MPGSETPILADTHCHLDFDAFDADRQEVLEKARLAGIRRILNPGVDLASSRAALELANKNEEVVAAVGIHPNEARSFTNDSLEELKQLASHSKVKAIGEIGLDYYRDRAPRDLQQEVFNKQLDLAASLNLPVIVHNRQASADILDILEAWQSHLVASGSILAERPGVLHSFSADYSIAERAIRLNFFIGITGPVTFRNAPELQQVVARLPVEHLLIETDAPFLAPHPQRGKRNEPAFVTLVAEKIASLQNRPVAQVAAETYANAIRLFNW